MGYDNMLRLKYHVGTATYNTYTYDAAGLKRFEDGPASRITIIWDGSNYLGTKS